MKKLSCLACCLLVCLTAFYGCGQKQYTQPTIENNSVLELTLYAFDASSEKVFGLMNLGHGFVSLKNISDTPLIVGGFVLDKDTEVSVGTWGQNAHWGIWYNLESKYMTLGRYDGRISVTQGVSQAKLGSLNAYLLASDKWTPLKNCSYFAVDVWNIVALPQNAIDLVGLITPTKVSRRLTQTEGHKINRPIQNFGKIGYSLNGNATDFIEFTLKDKDIKQ